MIWRSTTFRVAALVFLFQVVAAAVLLAGLGAVLRQQVADGAETTAEIMREELLAIYARGSEAGLIAEIGGRHARPTGHGAAILLVDRTGQRLAGNLADWPPSLSTVPGYVEVDLYRIGHTAPEAIRARTTRLPDGDRLLTGVVVESERQLLGLLERASMIAAALALAFAALVAWLVARLIVQRLDGTIATLDAVREGDLSRRVPDDASGDAFAVLGAEVNLTLDRLDALVDELRTATDSLAHDLKSPLNRLRIALERAAAQVREPAAQDALDRAQTESERLLAMVETALRITRAEAGIGRESFAPVDLAEMLETLAEIYAPLVEDHGREIVVVAHGPAMVRVHRELLGQALGNLIDNSLKYGGGTITLSLSNAPAGAVIEVADQGPGIPPERRETALRRFGRLDEARGGSGAGLGLSLVAAVARLHGGTVELGDAAPGLKVTMRLG